MKAVPGKNLDTDRVSLNDEERVQLASLMKDEKWEIYRKVVLTRCAMAKTRLYRRSLSGTKDFDVAPLVAYLSALEDSISPSFLVEEKQ